MGCLIPSRFPTKTQIKASQKRRKEIELHLRRYDLFVDVYTRLRCSQLDKQVLIQPLLNPLFDMLGKLSPPELSKSLKKALTPASRAKTVRETKALAWTIVDEIMAEQPKGPFAGYANVISYGGALSS